MDRKEERKAWLSRWIILAIALAMVLPSVSLASTGGHSTANTDLTQEYVMIEVSNPQLKSILKDAGIDIVEDYGNAVMAKVTVGQIASLGPQFIVKQMPDRNIISLNHYTFDVTKGGPDFPSDLKINSYEGGVGYYIVKFYGPVKEEWKNTIEHIGAHIFSPIYSNAFLVRMDDNTKAKVESMPQVSYVGIYQPAYKISKEVSGMNGPNCHIKILTFPEARNAVVAKLGRMFFDTGMGQLKLRYANGVRMSPTIANGRFGYIEAVVDSSLFDRIAKLPGVQYIEKYEQPKVMNDLAHSLEQSSNTASTGVGAPDSLTPGQADAGLTPVWAHGLFGQNMVIGLSDSGIAIAHDAFLDNNYSSQDSFPTNTYVSNHRKLVRYETYASTGYDNQPVSGSSDHGTHVACTIAGYDNPQGGSLAYDGGVPAAKISFSDIGNASDDTHVYPPSNLSETWELAREDGARVYSQSWGGSYSSQYSGDMVAIDQYLYDHPEFLMTWAAGNAGSSLNTVDGQAESKNGISVAASGKAGTFFGSGTEDGTDIVGFSSRGPTFDNRLKPDISDPGVAIDSADSNNLPDGSTSMQGTSMATPNTNWACALIEQYFLEGWYPTGEKTSGNEIDPSGALVKAVLLNGAVEMTGSGAEDNAYNGNGGYPSVDQGWGFVNLNNSMYFSGDRNSMQIIDSKSGMDTGQYIEYKYKVTDTSDPLVVTLDWYDYPATPGSTKALVNDYDLTVTDPSGNTYKGNVFTGSNPGYSASNSGDYDHTNNVEEVKVISGHGLATGIWTVRVAAYNIQVGPQPFALVVNGDLDRGYGQVYLDNTTYSEKSTANIRVEDPNAAGSSVTVTVTSANTGDSENVSCTEQGSGVFTGHISFTLSASSSDDGFLSVTDKDTITATYNDDNPVHTSTAKAIIDAKGPVISDVKATDVSMFSAKIMWNTDEKANAKVYYGTSPTNLDHTTMGHNIYSTTPSVVLKGLSGNTLYYYDVESADRFGHVTRDDNGGSHYTFSTPGKGNILLVVSDDGTTQSYWNMTRIIDSYKWSMDQYGWTYNVWRTWEAGKPPLSTLQSYLAVIWQVGWEYYPPFNATERQLITDYNDGGGRLWVVSHDVMWAFGDSSSSNPFYSTEANNWMKDQMKADWKTDPTTISTISGVSGDPISGDYTGGISYQQFRSGGAGDEVATNNAGGTSNENWEDDNNKIVGVEWISSAANGTSGTGVWGGTPSKFTGSFWEWSNLISNSTVDEPVRAAVLNKTLVWLIGNDHPDVTVTYPKGGESITSDTITVTWDTKAYGGASIDKTSLYYSSNGGQAWNLISDSIGSATSYNWDISSLPNGNDYMVKVIVTDNGNPALSGSNVSDSSFTINRPGGDTLAPVTVAGTVSAEPIPAVQGNEIWYNATIDDSNKGNSNIIAAEYFIDSTGNDGSGTAMNATDGSFNSPTENVTWSGICNVSPGTHTLYVHGEDSAGNWGSFESVNFTVNPGPFINVNVTAGWNLISLPWQKDDATITDALSGISWDRAMVYINGIWYTYNTARADKYNLGFPNVNNKIGIWVHATANGTLTGSNANIGPTDISLGTGWNLVGYPSNTVDTVSNVMSNFGGTYDYIQAYDTSSGEIITLTSSDNMEPGNAYWIHVTSAGTWTVNW